MSIIIRLQNLPLEANSLDIRRFFHGLQIPDGGVHIVGGENGDAFIAFANDEDARQAMERNGNNIKGSRIKLLLSSRNEMQRIIDAARNQTMSIIPPTQQNISAMKSIIPVPQQQPQKLLPQQQLQSTLSSQQSQQQQQQQPLPPPPSYANQHPGNFQQFPNPIQQQQQQQLPPSSTLGNYYPTGSGSIPNVGGGGGSGGPMQSVRYPPPTSANDFHHHSNFGQRSNDRPEIQFRSRSRSRSPPPTKESNNTMQTGLIRSLQQQTQPPSLPQSSSTASNLPNYGPQTTTIGNNNNIDPRYSNYQSQQQPSLQQQQHQQESFGSSSSSSYRQMPGIVGQVTGGIGTMPHQQQGEGIGGWNNNINNNNNNINNTNDNYRQTSVNDYNNRKMDSIHSHQQQQPQQSSSVYGQQQQQQSSTTSSMMLSQNIRPPQSTQQPQQQFTLQLNDLPLNIKSNDLMKFFQPLYLDEDNIKIFYDSKGFPTGIALVRFGSPKEWEHALTYNNRFIGDRRIQVRPLDDVNVNNNNNNQTSSINNNLNGPSQQPLLQQPPPIIQSQPLIANPPPQTSTSSLGAQQQPQQRLAPPILPPQPQDQYRSSSDNNYPRNLSEEFGNRGPPLLPTSQQFNNGGVGPSPPTPSQLQSTTMPKPSSSHHHQHHHRGKYQPRYKEHALFMKGLPFANCTTKDVAQFFHPIKLFHIEIEFENRNKPTGNAFVEFFSPHDVDHAMSYNMRNMGHRYIELIPWLLYEKYGPTYHLPSAPPPPKFMRGGNSNRGPPLVPPPPQLSHSSSSHGTNNNHNHHQRNNLPITHCILMRGLARHIETPDIKQFFSKSNINTYAVHIMLTSDKMNAGEAFVEFLTKDEQNRALDMNGLRLSGERINIKPISYDVVRSNIPTPPPPPPHLQQSSMTSSSSSSSTSSSSSSSSKLSHHNHHHHHHGKYRRGGGPNTRTGNYHSLNFDKSTTLLAKNLSHKTTVDDLCRFFDHYNMTPNRIKLRPSTTNFQDDQSNNNNNDNNNNNNDSIDNIKSQEAQILFFTRADCEHAIRNLDKRLLNDRKIHLTYL